MISDLEAVVAGHICLDLHPDLSGAAREPFEKIFRPGHLIASGPVSFATGGAVSNTGLALHRLGVRTKLVGKVGDDQFGETVCRIIASHGENLTDCMIIDPASGTSYTVIINYPGVDRIFLHSSGVNDTFQAHDIPYQLLNQARLFHFGYPPLMRATFTANGTALADIFRRARNTGITTSLDMAFPDPASEAGRADWQSILQGVLPYVDIFIPSVEEILFMMQRATYEEMCGAAAGSNILPLITPRLLSDIAQELIEMGAGIVGLKLGYRGLYVRTDNPTRLISMGRARPSNPEAWATKELWAPCFKVAVAGTTGSGDATIAGFLAALLRDLSLEESLRLAVAIGACNVEAVDALSGIQSWETTRARMDAGWEQQTLDLDDPHWNFDEGSGLWRGPAA
ncbi:MAG TPA: carbohydrate kinase family protein [Anaerolineales bacterium]|nr:carbohydrate kinase family protein [Anaerolineales bacterium]